MRPHWMLAAGAAGLWLGARRAIASSFYEGKAVLITGGSRGLGLILARELARRGARLAICARDKRELEAARAELGDVLAIPCDVGDEAQARALVEQTVRHFGRLDVVINNAGIIQVAPLSSMEVADFREAMQINFYGVLHTALAALPHLSRNGRGRLVNICSIGGAVAVPHLAPYTASKYAAVGFSEALQAEARGVCVTTVLPAPMRTGSFVNALFKGDREREVEWFSLTSSLPGSSVSAERAACSILRAAAMGDAWLTIGAQGKLLRLVHALAPGLVGRALSLAARLLPSAASGGPAEPGWQHRGRRTSWTRLGDAAARRNREVPWAPPETA